MGHALLLVQLVVILFTARGLAWLLRWIGQPPVIGEMIAGLALGPLVFGALAPAWQGWLFAPASLPMLDGLIERLEHVTMIALMPVFFALTGLSTSVDAFRRDALGALALILLIAVVGKVVGGALGARLDGHGWRDSFAVGSLMNGRGMIELIVLKIGLDAGVIGHEMFTLPLMAIFTTMMTTPMLLYFSRHRRLATAACSRHPDQD